ncbi:MAG: amidohydrolase family protein [Hyphomicrobiales bacterium]
MTEELRQAFSAEADRLIRAGVVGFGEMTALHFSFFAQHAFMESPPDHPLFLLLADIAASHDVPIDLHMEIVPAEMAVPEKLRHASKHNPQKVSANLAALERLLSHNRKTRIVLAHSMDSTGNRTPQIIRGLLTRNPNLYMSLNVLRQFLFVENLPLKGSGGIKPDWVQLIRDFPDRFVIGSDQFYSAPCPGCKMKERVQASSRWLELLPGDIANKMALENPRRIYALDSR